MIVGVGKVSAVGRFSEEMMLQFDSEGCLEAEFLLPWRKSVLVLLRSSLNWLGAYSL